MGLQDKELNENGKEEKGKREKGKGRRIRTIGMGETEEYNYFDI